RMADTFAITLRHAPAPRDILVEMAQLHPQQRGLDLVQSRVDALEQVVVLRVGAVVAQRRDTLRQSRVAGHDGAPVAQGAEVLGRVEAEGGRVAERAGLAPVAGRAVRLR